MYLCSPYGPKIVWFLFLQPERGLYADDLCGEGFVDLYALLYLCAGMDDGGMVTVADKLTDAAGGHLRVFLREIHRYLPGHDIVALPAFRVDLSRRHVVRQTDLF